MHLYFYFAKLITIKKQAVFISDIFTDNFLCAESSFFKKRTPTTVTSRNPFNDFQSASGHYAVYNLCPRLCDNLPPQEAVLNFGLRDIFLILFVEGDTIIIIGTVAYVSVNDLALVQTVFISHEQLIVHYKFVVI